MHPGAEDLETAFLGGIAAGDPTRIVKEHVRQGLLDDWFGDLERPRMIRVIALGKAAPRMTWGLVEANVPFRGIGVAPKKQQVPLIDTMTWHRGDHPVPGDDSFAAGQALLDWVETVPSGEPVLVLLSGGTSSLAEVPRDCTRDELLAHWQDWMRRGETIAQLNHHRMGISAIKGGRLGRRLLEQGADVRVWILADTPPEKAAMSVGSGPFWQGSDPDRIPHRVLADNLRVVEGAGAILGGLGYQVYRYPDRLDGPVEEMVPAFLSSLAKLHGGKVALVGGGEPTIALPPDAPPGGRAQHATALAAKWLADHDHPGLFLAGGTDGADGVPGVAATWSDAALWKDDPEAAQVALDGFATHPFLEAADRTIHTGPTGTNLNDVWIATIAPRQP